MSSQNSPVSTVSPSSDISSTMMSEQEQQQYLEWKEKQEIAEAQEEEIMEQDWKYREYAKEQNEKYNKYNDDMKTFTLADTPKVQIYKNYVLYDRFMPYDRFRMSIKFNQDPDDNSQEAEKEYYYNNYSKFLVVKFSRGSNFCVILFDTEYNCLYTLGNPISDYGVFVNRHDKHAYLNIKSTKPDSYCLNIIDDLLCSNKHNNSNGYCDECQYNSQELEKLDCDRMLTYSEFICLPEFKDFYYLEFHENDYDSDCADFDDYDDRRYGPENTIEDDEDDVVEEKEEKWMEGDDECLRKTIKRDHSFYEYTTKNGRYHSFNDQPAFVEEEDDLDKSSYVWYKDGKKHRLTGVAEQMHKDSDDYALYVWWIDGKRYDTKEEFQEAVRVYEEKKE